MNILIVGSGGREHTLAWKMNQSSLCSELFITPGNGGTAQIGTNITLDLKDIAAIKSFCQQHEIKMIVVGPEIPLVDGLYDLFKSDDHLKDIHFIGPSAQGAILEGSKAFAKSFMIENAIPTAKYLEVEQQNISEGINFLESMPAPYVLKADGLAAGKGVLILDSLEEAKAALKNMLNGQFGNASSKVVIEEFLDGLEFSVFALTDGKEYLLFPEAKDYKRIGEGDTGLNTGGMGAISPVPFVNEVMMNKVIAQIVKPTIEGLNKAPFDYVGFVFFGLIEVNGDPKVIEYNCRLGDPETEVIIPRIKNDLVELFLACANGTLANQSIELDERTAATVMLVSGGYPEAYVKGKPITFKNDIENSIVFQAGTKIEDDMMKTNGGRVLAITSFGKDISSAVSQSLANADSIDFEGKYYRSDIGKDLL